MIVKTVGVALRIDPFSRTSQIVTWLTPDHGRLVTLAKGVRRSRNPLAGQYDLFYTSEILFYSSFRSTVQTLKECSSVDARMALRQNWRASVAASYLCDVVNHVTPSGATQSALFDFLNMFLDFIVAYGISPAVLHWSELKLLDLLGVGPQLMACQSCGTREFHQDEPVYMAIADGGVLCLPCRTKTVPTAYAISQDVLAMLRTWKEVSSPTIARRTSCTAAQTRSLGTVLGDFIRYHLEPLSRTRDIALELISFSPAIGTGRGL